MANPSRNLASRTAGDPTVAVLLTWFLPGAGHLYLGRVRTAALAFLLIEGLYALGVFLSGGMFMEYLPAELRGKLAPVLSPEAGNLGALIYHVGEFGYGTGSPRPWPIWMDVGTTLTALSGLLNVLLMSSAHITARQPAHASSTKSDPALAAGASLLIPGLGQFLQGRRGRGVLIAASTIGLFLLASVLADGANLDRERHFYYWAGQFCLGLPAIVVEFWNGHPRIGALVPYEDAGVILGCIAGMLNILVMLDAYGFSERKLLGGDPENEQARPLDEGSPA